VGESLLMDRFLRLLSISFVKEKIVRQVRERVKDGRGE